MGAGHIDYAQNFFNVKIVRVNGIVGNELGTNIGDAIWVF